MCSPIAGGHCERAEPAAASVRARESLEGAPGHAPLAAAHRLLLHPGYGETYCYVQYTSVLRLERLLYPVYGEILLQCCSVQFCPKAGSFLLYPGYGETYVQ